MISKPDLHMHAAQENRLQPTLPAIERKYTANLFYITRKISNHCLAHFGLWPSPTKRMFGFCGQLGEHSSARWEYLEVSRINWWVTLHLGNMSRKAVSKQNSIISAGIREPFDYSEGSGCGSVVQSGVFHKRFCDARHYREVGLMSELSVCRVMH